MTKKSAPPTDIPSEVGPEVTVARTTQRIENHTSRFIVLPPTSTFPKGVRLQPGLNTVPIKYIKQLEAVSRSGADEEGEVVVLFPGRKALADLQQTVSLHTARGMYHGPQITMYHPDDRALDGRDDGPPPPMTLPMNQDAAKAIVNATNNRTALERWSTQGNTEAHQAAAAKLTRIKGNG